MKIKSWNKHIEEEWIDWEEGEDCEIKHTAFHSDYMNWGKENIETS